MLYSIQRLKWVSLLLSCRPPEGLCEAIRQVYHDQGGTRCDERRRRSRRMRPQWLGEEQLCRWVWRWVSHVISQCDNAWSPSSIAAQAGSTLEVESYVANTCSVTADIFSYFSVALFSTRSVFMQVCWLHSRCLQKQSPCQSVSSSQQQAMASSSATQRRAQERRQRKALSSGHGHS